MDIVGSNRIAFLGPPGQNLLPGEPVLFERLFDGFQEQVKTGLSSGADLFVIEGVKTLEEARAGLLAVKENTASPVWVLMPFDEEGKTDAGADIVSSLVLLQAMGADGFGLSRDLGPGKMQNLVERLSPYRKIPFGLRLDGKIACVRKAAESLAVPPAEEIMVATPKALHFLDLAFDFAHTLECSAHMGEEIMDCEAEGASAIRVLVSSGDDVEYLRENLYMIEMPLCVATHDIALLTRVARMYGGNLLFDNAEQLPKEQLDPLCKKYGMLVIGQ